jgi:CubicO group peptidase (beta-lactamase class C family)
VKYIYTSIRKSWPVCSGKLLRFIFLCFICTSSGLLLAQESVRNMNLGALDEEIQLLIGKYQVPLVGFAILRKGQTPYIRVHGMANKEAGTSAALTTQCRIASISKMIVSIAIMQLVAAVAASIVEKKTRMNFYNYAEQNIFTPLGIESATYSKPGARVLRATKMVVKLHISNIAASCRRLVFKY